MPASVSINFSRMQYAHVCMQLEREFGNVRAQKLLKFRVSSQTFDKNWHLKTSTSFRLLEKFEWHVNIRVQIQTGIRGIHRNYLLSPRNI